ncbi:MAG TPA: tetratricopeptide repeat protein, partial [Cyclobacteriaceae bacterium]
IYYELFKINSTSNTQKAIYYCQLAYRLSSQYKHVKLQVNSSYDLANLYDANNKPDSSITYFHKAIEVSSLNKLNDWLIYLYNELGQLHRRIDVYDSALHYFTLSYNVANETHALQGQAIATYNIGIVHSNLENYKEAVLHFKEAIQIKQSNGITQGLNLNLINLARVLNIQGLHDEAIQQLKQVELNCKTGCDENILADLHYQLGYSDLFNGKSEEAYTLFTKALVLARKNNIDQTIANCLFQLSSLEFDREAYQESLKLLTEAEHVAVKINHRRLLKDIYLLYSKVYAKMKLDDKGLRYKEKYHQLKDSIFNQNMVNYVSDIRLTQQSKKSDAIIEQKETALSASYIIIAMLVVIAILAITIIILVSRALVSSRKHREAMELHIVQTLDYREYSEKELFKTHMEFTSLSSRVTNFLNSPVALLLALATDLKSNATTNEQTEAANKMIRACTDIIIVLNNMNDLILYKNHEVIADEIDIASLAEEVSKDFKEMKSFVLLTINIEPPANRSIKSDKKLLKAAMQHAINYFSHVSESNPVIEIIFSMVSDNMLKVSVKHHSVIDYIVPFRSQFNHLTVMVTSGKLGGDFQVVKHEDYTVFEVYIPVNFPATIDKTSRRNIS